MKQLQWKDKYESMNKKELKLCLHALKKNQAPYSEIQYVSWLLRSKINKSEGISITFSNVDDQIQRNFWGYIKRSFNHKNALLPKFSASVCTEFFSNSFLL